MVEVALKDVTKIFGEGPHQVIAVDHFTLTVADGRLVTLLGPSGCGKTTTLRMVAGFEHPTSGEIFIGERRVNDVPPQRRGTAMVFQSYGLFPHLNVFENVAYGLKVRRLPRREIRRRVQDALKLVGLEGMEKRLPGQLSGGQQQRVALCRAIVTEPQVLLFDEPLSNLDAKLRIEMRVYLRDLQKNLGITSIYVTHDQEEAMSIADELVIMKDGRIEQVGPPLEVYARPANRFVAEFIGKANFLPVQVVSVTDGRVRVRLGELELEVAQDGEFTPGERVELMIRPEAVELLPLADSTGSLGDGIDLIGQITYALYTGSIASYGIELSDGRRLEVKVANPQEEGLLQRGARVGVRLHRKSLYLLHTER